MHKSNKAFSLRSQLNIGRAGAGIIDFERWLGIARRQWRVVMLCAFALACLGAVYALTAVPLYTAKISLLIDTANSKVVEQLSSFGGIVDDEASVLSQVELLRSQTIGAGVVDKLKLVDNADFMSSGGSALAMIKHALVSIIDVRRWFVSGEVDTETAEKLRQDAIESITNNISVGRVGRTYVLEVSYTSASAGLAAGVANGIGEAYLRDKLDSKYDATRRASDWLQDRIDELRQQALQSDLAVQRFRSANGLVSAGTTLVSDQQLSELNSALVVAQSETAAARAKYDGIQLILKSDPSNAIVTDVLANSISNDLRTKYLAAEKLEGELSERLGKNHIQAVKLRDEMAQYAKLMFDEVKRIGESYRSELSVAEAREKSIFDSVGKATGVSAAANETQVQLRELEREAETYRNLYQAFLGRYQEAIQQQSFPITDARMISKAVAPTNPSYPNKALLVAFFAFVGAAGGVGLGFFREFRDRFFRTGDQVRDELGLEFLGIAPLIKSERVDLGPVVEGDRSARLIRKVDVVTNYVVDHPLSAFAETLRSAKIAADLAAPAKTCRIIGIISTLPGEGKSTVAINFAELLAKQGSRTVLIDGDLRNPGATRAIGQHAKSGLLQVLLEEMPFQDVLLYNDQTKLAFLPAVIKHRVPHSSELLTSPNMQRILTTLSASADYIIIDLPPLGPVIDARAMAGKIDGFMFVTEWGKTSRSAVRHTLENEHQIVAKCFGVVLNKVDYEKLKLYRAFGSTEYYYSRYSQYYHEKE